MARTVKIWLSMFSKKRRIALPVAEAKPRLSGLIARAEAGEEIFLARHGKPVARLLTAEAADPQARRAKVEAAFRQLAALRRQVHIEGDLKLLAREGLG